MPRRAPFRTLDAALEDLLDYVSSPRCDELFESPRTAMAGVIDRAQQLRRFVGKAPETVKERNARRDRVAGRGK